MGSYMVFDVEFKKKEDYLKFMKLIKEKFGYETADYIGGYDDTADGDTIRAFFHGWWGYAEPEMMVEDIIEKYNLSCIFFASNRLSDRCKEWDVLIDKYPLTGKWWK